MKIIFLGAPGAGKGTQAEIFSEKLGIPTISTGNILRAAIQAGTPVGVQAKALIDAGQLVPDEVILAIVQERLSHDDCAKGFILDGVPRTLAQAQAMEDMGITIDRVVDLEVSDDVIVRRMSGRRVCENCGAPYHVEANPPQAEGVCDHCGGKLVTRKDDRAETVKERLEVYHSVTEPLRKFYGDKGLLCTVPGDKGSVEDISAAVAKALGV